MQFTISPKTLTITSAIKAADMKRVAKFNNKALTLYDKDGNAVFAFAFGKTGSITKFGIMFDGVSIDEEGNEFATATIYIDAVGLDETRAAAEEMIAPAIENAEALEEALRDAVVKYDELTERVNAAFTIA